MASSGTCFPLCGMRKEMKLRDSCLGRQSPFYSVRADLGTIAAH